MKTAKELHATACAVSDNQERKKAINGLLETAAESGEFSVRFKSSEYPHKDFDHLLHLGYRVVANHDNGTVTVNWSEPTK